MNDLFEAMSKNVTSMGGYVAAALLAIAALLPKLLNGMKADRIDGELLKRLDEMDKKIHSQAVRITRLTVLVIRLEALLIANKIDIPKDLQDDLDELRQQNEAML